MAEYLITTDAGEWPPVHKERLPLVLMPPESGCAPEEGWGDFRMRCGEAVLVFSGEESGWQVLVEGADEADALIEALTQRIADEVQQPCHWISLG